MVELCGATLAPGTIDVAEPEPPARVLRLREHRVESILGVAVPAASQAEILERLEFATKPAPDGLEVTVPALRREDVTREVDLIEEVARIDGLERLPATLPARRGAVGILAHEQRVRRAAEDAMVGRGLREVVGWSFAEPELLDRLRLGPDDEMRRVVTIENPMSEAQSIMRPTLLGSLLDVAAHNVARNGPDVAIFESGTVYRAAREGAGAEEHHGLGVVLTGSPTPRSWRGPREDADFFAVKALLGSMLDKLHVEWSVQPWSRPFLHPGRSAAVMAGPGEPRRLGFVGEVHPLVASAWDLERAAVFAVDLGAVAVASPEVVSFRSFPSVPALRQDLAVTLPDSVAVAEVIDRVRDAGGEMLEAVSLFDVYTGGQVGDGRRSLALALSFQAKERTLTDEDVMPARERIVAALGELGGELRG
jgi:phenylalanyl-tRNA synthetase beta chain